MTAGGLEWGKGRGGGGGGGTTPSAIEERELPTERPMQTLRQPTANQARFTVRTELGHVVLPEWLHRQGPCAPRQP